MGRVAAIGEAVRLQGLSLAGVVLLPGDDAAEVRASWTDVPEDVEVVILTPRASAALGPHRTGPLTVVMPP
jgi:vacuolar-type H+-ATPase subunit F/Vma7